MPLYLAYQFQPRQLTKKRLGFIIDEFYDFDINGKLNHKDIDSIIQKIEFNYQNYLKVGIKRPNNLISKATNFLGEWYVKEHPCLLMQFDYQRNVSHRKYIPDNFVGLAVNAGHSGSEGLVDLIEFKPEMDVYLRSIGINYEDRSNLELK